MAKTLAALIGSEYEENLALRYLAAAIEQIGGSAEIIRHNEAEDADEVAAKVVALAPLTVGISVPFQHRAPELLRLASELRERGYLGHICVGGHFATFEYESILRDVPAIDSVVRHEGEQTFAELCARLRGGAPLEGIPGLVQRAESGVRVGAPRPLPPLDTLPFPDRRGEPHDVLGVRAAPIIGSRGCYADCSFCCIFAYADAARGPRYRMRSPESIVREMKAERERRGVRLFVFHDDNFFLPHAPKNRERYRRFAGLLREEGLEDVGLVIKCRPNDVEPELFELLKSIGIIRAYVGIETNSDEGIVSLNRRITSDDNRRALDLLRRLDIYCSFNVLLFDPEATLEGIARNIDFMAQHAETPFNFCRAEVYAGTPLKAMLEKQGRLHGNYLAWNYEMREPRVELLFRMCTTAFAGRNFKPDGLASLNMGIRFDNEVMRRFYPAAWDVAWHRRLLAFSRAVGEDTVARLEEALSFVRRVDLADRQAICDFALALARGVAAADLARLGEIKLLRREMETRVRVTGAVPARPFGRGMPVWAAETARLASSVGLGASNEILPAPSAPVRSGVAGGRP